MQYRTAFLILGLGFVILAGGVYISGFSVWNVLSKLAPYVKTDIPVSEPSAFAVPDGFKVSVFASDVPGARVLTRDPKGTMLVSQTSEGRVSALSETGHVTTVLDGLNGPHGIVFVGPDLYIAEEDAVKKYAYDPATMRASSPETVAVLPADGGHATRSLYLDPSGKTLLVAVGSSCNVCNESDVRRATILAIDLLTKEVSVYARGLRNTVFMTTNPIDGALWGTEMGRDLLGDDIPPDEINILEKGSNYGWPVCYGQNVHDAVFDKNTYIRNPCMAPFETPATVDIPAHSAPLGIAFVPEEGWPEEMRLDVLVAYHGSWNRSEPAGYKVVRYDLRDLSAAPIDFMTGFLTPQGVIGRPVAILAEPGGTVYISDDKAGAVYRVSLVDESKLE